MFLPGFGIKIISVVLEEQGKYLDAKVALCILAIVEIMLLGKYFSCFSLILSIPGALSLVFFILLLISDVVMGLNMGWSGMSLLKSIVVSCLS